MVLQLCKLCNNEGRQLKSISSRNGDRETCRRGRRDRTRGKEYLSEQRLRFEAYLLARKIDITTNWTFWTTNSNRLALDNFFSTFVPSALINNSLPIERIDKAVTKLLNSCPRHRVKIRSRQRNTVTGSSKGGLKWGERPSKFILRQCRDYTPP